MNLTKKVIAGVLIVGFLTTFLALPKAAEADGGWHGHSHHNNAAPFWGGLAFGAVTGLAVGAVVASRPVYAAPPVVYTAPPPVVYQPAPVVVYQPAPVCTSYWVPAYWTGYQWVQGYWAQACR